MPKISIKIILCVFILSSSFGYSQTQRKILLDCKSEILKPGKRPQPLNFSSTLQPYLTNNSFLDPIQPAKKPMFCRMEDNLHKRFNVWIVMRAGSDEEYKKLIDEKDKPKSKEIP